MEIIKRIGFVGLGKMGFPMVNRLKEAGFEVYISDSDELRSIEVKSQLGVQSLDENSYKLVDVLITMLPDSDTVEEVLLGETGYSGLAHQLRKSSVIIDMSTSDPVRSRVLGVALAGLDLNYLDAPVSGGVKRAVDGGLAILVGGEKNIFEECKSVLEAMGKNILYIGSAGSGHAAKALNNLVSATGLVVTVEALHVAERFGIDVSVMADVLNSSTGKTNTSENKVKQYMLNEAFDSGFSMLLMNKDLKIAHSLSQVVEAELTVGEALISIWNKVSQDATPLTDHTQMYQMLRKYDGCKKET